MPVATQQDHSTRGEWRRVWEHNTIKGFC